jgi:hypothetical protein
VSDREIDTPYGEYLARPQHIIVYDFAATADQIPPESGLAGQVSASSQPLTPEELAAGRQLGQVVARELVAEIKKMGLPAVRAEDQPTRGPGDIVIRGYFTSIDKGSTLERVVIGFGAGSAELKTYVEGFEVTTQGLRRLGSGDLDSGGAKGPGLVVPMVVTLATANPIGLVVGGAVKVAGEVSGHDRIEGAGKRTAEEIAKQLRPRFEEQGWIK